MDEDFLWFLSSYLGQSGPNNTKTSLETAACYRIRSSLFCCNPLNCQIQQIPQLATEEKEEKNNKENHTRTETCTPNLQVTRAIVD